MINTFEQGIDLPIQLSTVDPMLDTVKAKLSENAPLRQRISQYLETGLSARVSNQVICFRSQDVVTTLMQIADGKIDVHYTENDLSIMGKLDGFYTTFNPEHEFFRTGDGKDLVRKSDTRTFQEVAYDNAETYGLSIPFATAVMRNVFPVLGLDAKQFIEFSRKQIAGSNEWALEHSYSPHLILEDYLERIRKEVENIKNVKEFGRNRYPYTHDFLKLIKNSKSSAEVLGFLQRTAQVRAGIMIGFSDEILTQGEMETEFSGDLNASGSELVIKPADNIIRLHDKTIVGLEPLGEYEEGILDDLGLVR